ncbi:MAG: hypothetical protein U0353_17495 [Sandaracinus sp.]
MELATPNDLSSTIHGLADLLADDRRIPADRRQDWLVELRLATRTRGFMEPDRRGPLARLGAVIVAAHRGPAAIGRNERSEQAALVDWLAERWELGRRDADFSLSPALSRLESAKLLSEVFDVIARAISVQPACSRTSVEAEISRFVKDHWQMAPGRAAAVARASFSFWDEAGVFVAYGSGEIVQAGQETLRELGYARFLAAHETGEGRGVWIQNEATKPENWVVTELLAELAPDVRVPLLKRWSFNTDVVFSVARGTASAMARAGAADVDGLQEVEAALVRIVGMGGPVGWEALEILLTLPPVDSSRLNLVSVARIAFDTDRASFAAAMVDVYWGSANCNLASAIERLRQGPPPGFTRESGALAPWRADTSFGRFAVALARRVELTDVAAVTLLLQQDHVSAATYDEVRAVLRERGYTGPLEIAFSREQSARLAIMHREYDELEGAFFDLVGRLAAAEPISYGERRRLTEFVDFDATAVPGDMIAAAFSAHMKNIDMIRPMLGLVLSLGGFRVGQVVAGLEVLRAEGLLESGRRWWRFQGRERDLDVWPHNDVERREVLERVLELFRMPFWGSLLALKAVSSHPEPKLVSGLLSSLLPVATPGAIRWQIAGMILVLDEPDMGRCRRWLAEGDGVQRHAAAVFLVSQAQKGRAEVADVRHAMAVVDEAAREAARQVARDAQSRGEGVPSDLIDALADSESIPGGDWTCIWCEKVSAAGLGSCAHCGAVRRAT